MPNKLTLRECQELAKSKGGECLSTKYEGIDFYMLWRCKKGHEWFSTMNCVKNSDTWCMHPDCRYKKYTIEDCHECAKSRNGKCLETIFIRTDVKMRWECESGHQWLAPFSRINMGGWCLKCNKLTIQDCINFAVSKNWKCLSTTYVNMRAKMLWECEFGHQWLATFHNIKVVGNQCPHPDCDQRKHVLQDCIDVAASKNGKCLETHYVNADTYMSWECEFGHQWLAKFKNVKGHNTWCPHCPQSPTLISKPQKEIHSYLIQQFPDKTIILNDTFIIKPKHLDIYIPDLKLGIEFDGEYWHYSERAINGKHSLEKMASKDQVCQTKNITLIRIREKDWLSNKAQQLQSLFNLITHYSFSVQPFLVNL